MRLCVLFAAVSCFAAEPASDVQFLLGLASAAPPEIAADAKLRIAEDSTALPVDERAQLIEDAFALAASAQHPYRRAAVEGLGADTAASYLAAVSALNFDRMSLERRAVELMLRVKPAKALELFARMNRPAIPAIGCQEGLIPDVSAYWEAAAAMARARRADGTGQLEALFASADSIVELAPAARLLNNTPLDADSFDLLLGALAARIESASASYRAFAHSDAAFRAELEQLAARASRLNLPVLRLARAYSGYLAANLKAPRCADKPQYPRQAADWFNEKFRGDLPEVKLDDMKPSGKGGGIQLDEIWTGDGNEKIRRAVQELRVDERGVVRSIAERRKPEWRRKLADLIGEIGRASCRERV